jgi:hypothetical protein
VLTDTWGAAAHAAAVTLHIALTPINDVARVVFLNRHMHASSMGVWSELAPMTEDRSYFCACVLGSDIYVCRGDTGSDQTHCNYDTAR